MSVEPILRERINLAFQIAARQLRQLIETYPDYLPVHTVGGRWGRETENWTHWCDGFLGGQLWLVYHHIKDPWFQQQAVHYTHLVEPRQLDPDSHDLGFIFWPTWKRWYDLSGDVEHNRVVIQAGRTLAGRFQEKGGYLASFAGPHSLFIDIMMNVGLVFYAAQQTDDERLWHVANRHCLTTRCFLVRGDGSTAQVGLFDPRNGRFLGQRTHQGWRDDSTWARGQTWALYGFATAYSFTQDPRFLETAQDCADFYIRCTSPKGIPPNDWNEPRPRHPYESSSAAIAASGFLNLARLCSDRDREARYREYALRILDTLTTPEFLVIDMPGWEGILQHGIYHLPMGVGVDESLAWGDYYFLEALSKLS